MTPSEHPMNADGEPSRNVRIHFWDGRTVVVAAENAWQYEEMNYYLRTEELEST